MTEAMIDRLLAEENRPGVRPEILPSPLPHYEHNFSKIPEQIRVSFSDGSTAVYDLRVVQPSPVIIENIRLIRKMKQGYVNRPERRRKQK